MSSPPDSTPRTAEPLRVFLVEDSDPDARYLTELLRHAGRPFEVTRRATLAEAREFLPGTATASSAQSGAPAYAAPPIDILLIDLHLPDSSGLDTLHEMTRLAPGIPILVLTGLNQEEAGVHAVQSGAQDYLVKGEFNGPLLARAIRYAIERQRAEVSLRASEERYRELFENANDAVYILGLDGNFASVNEAAVRISGYTREELLHMNIGQVIADPDLARGVQMRDRKLRGEAVETRYAVELIRKDGARRTLDVSSRLIYRGAQPVAVQGIARDVTEQRALEQRLRHSQKMEAIGRTAGGVAHEFNNLLTIITGHTELVLESLTDDGALRNQLMEIGRAAERAARITRELLTVSRHRVSSPRLLNLNEIVARMEVLLQPFLGDEIKFHLALTPGELPVHVDVGLIEQVILNLAFNARDAMPQGGELRIETSNTLLAPASRSNQAGEDPYAVLRVSDTGIGMSPETQSRIFEPFFSTKEVGKGTGLGLAVVFGVISQSGGHIEVNSAPGRGSTFTIFLPLAQAGGRDTVAAAGSAARKPEGSETLLLVEDEDGVRRVLKRALVARGYRVLEAANGSEALEVAQASGPIDLLITDVAMPDMRGPEVAARLRALSPESRVLYISGYAEDRPALEGSDPYLQKPFTPDVLAAKVRQVLEPRHTAARRVK